MPHILFTSLFSGLFHVFLPPIYKHFNSSRPFQYLMWVNIPAFNTKFSPQNQSKLFMLYEKKSASTQHKNTDLEEGEVFPRPFLCFVYFYYFLFCLEFLSRIHLIRKSAKSYLYDFGFPDHRV